MADQVDASLAVRQLVQLDQSLLHAVFAELDLAGGQRFADRFGRVSFGDGDQPHLARIAVGALADLRDLGANRCKALSDRQRVRGHRGRHAVGAVSWSSEISAGSGA